MLLSSNKMLVVIPVLVITASDAFKAINVQLALE
jgi:hypothetical protein